jgi:hypothetical protein
MVPIPINDNGSSATSVFIDNNDNENSIDPNPYAYPYFHSNQSMPLLYNLITTQFGKHHNGSNGNSNETRNGRGSLDPVREEEHQAAAAQHTNEKKANIMRNILNRKRQFFMKRIQVRFQSYPREVNWVDSCGENALFRFSQLVRFQNVGRTRASRAAAADAMARHYNNNNNNNDGIIFQVLHHFIECENTLLKNDDADGMFQTLNKWGETALHQFATHCGFEYNDAFHSENLAHEEKGGGEYVTGASTKFMQQLLQASPATIHICDFQKSLALHNACSLSQYSKSFSTSASNHGMISMRKLLSIHHRQQPQQKQHHDKDHYDIIQLLVKFYPKGVLATDSNGCTPLYRAVDSIHCSSDIVSFLLEQMELLFIKNGKDTIHLHEKSPSLDKKLLLSVMNPQQNQHHCQEERILLCTKFLLNKAIMGYVYDNNDDRHHRKYNQDTKRINKMPGRKMKHQTKNETQTVASPMEAIWKTYLIKRHIPSNMIKLSSLPLIQHDDDKTINGNLPDISIAEIIQTTLETTHETNKRKRQSTTKYQNELANDLSQRLGALWQKMMNLMLCAYHGTTNKLYGRNEIQGLFPIHAAIYCSAPSFILNMLCAMYPQELTNCDDNGNTPLLLALKTPSFKQRWKNMCLLDCKVDTDEDYCQWKPLLKLSPKSASIPGKRQRLPLHVAIENGYAWNNGLQQLFESFPEALSTKDPTNGLLPFMMILSSPPSDSYCSNHNEQLDDTYRLLRSDPTVLNLI